MLWSGDATGGSVVFVPCQLHTPVACPRRSWITGWRGTLFCIASQLRTAGTKSRRRKVGRAQTRKGLFYQLWPIFGAVGVSVYMPLSSCLSLCSGTATICLSASSLSLSSVPLPSHKIPAKILSSGSKRLFPSSPLYDAYSLPHLDWRKGEGFVLRGKGRRGATGGENSGRAGRAPGERSEERERQHPPPALTKYVVLYLAGQYAVYGFPLPLLCMHCFCLRD